MAQNREVHAMKIFFHFIRIIPFISLFLLGSFPIPVISSSATNRGVQLVLKNGQKLDLYHDYHALVIGISNYDIWPKLPSATNDAQEVAKRLKRMGFNVKLLVDPISAKMKNALNEMVYAEGSITNRAILLYYAGHGETETR
jgi:hypothetical protein